MGQDSEVGSLASRSGFVMPPAVSSASRWLTKKRPYRSS